MSSAATTASVAGSREETATSRPLSSDRSGEREHGADSNAGDGVAEAFTNHLARGRCGRRADREPHADFARAAADENRVQPGHAQRIQHERRHREPADHARDDAPLGELIAYARSA